MAEEERSGWVASIRNQGARSPKLAGVDRALADYGVKLTRTPAQMAESDVGALRTAGLDDVEIHDAIQVVSYFNYINRIADAVDVELEPEYPAHPGRP